ncbi:hypothetical protein [Nonomuraea sp. NPDC049646]|uniref:hypothetical protein n=1 Tax=unclassified Nonomuraea TaxID=2593643 RepID=UPI0037B4FBB2
MKYYVVGYNLPEIEPKKIWADDFRIGADGHWIEFVSGGTTTAYVRTETVLAIDCHWEASTPGEGALAEALGRSGPATPSASSGPGASQPSPAPAAGPVEASLRRPVDLGRQVAPVPA